jgi:hypothetical protein
MGQLSEHEGRYGQELQPRPDASSFDDLAKGLASGNLSRRNALWMLGAALVGGALASIPGAAWAACKPLSRKCTANTQCCSRNCIKNPKGNGKICGCPTGKTLCNNKCVTCNNSGEVVNPTTCQCEAVGCPAILQEVNPSTGECECPPTHPTLCNNPGDYRCSDTQTDTLNCGGCGQPCPAVHFCYQGTCRPLFP